MYIYIYIYTHTARFNPTVSSARVSPTNLVGPTRALDMMCIRMYTSG